MGGWATSTVFYLRNYKTVDRFGKVVAFGVAFKMAFKMADGVGCNDTYTNFLFQKVKAIGRY